MVKKIGSAEFEAEVLQAQGLVVVDMYADWCGPCKMMGPVLEGLSEDYADVKFVKVNVDEAGDLAAKYGVMSIPNFLFIKDGKLAGQSVGAKPADAFAEQIEALK